ncbi:MAG: exonuclease SbcCD subunit D [Holophagales bacterium]|nr:exonuclease SbcCD subunit D [Holophagales bacterium]MYC09322.1 exonuclease SbcCD subunit D [Holophagales bacterium]
MKLLHTSDWHVGKTLARRSRLDEARDVLSEIVEIAERESVDAVLVCGDVFDHTAPSAAAEKIVYDTLVAMELREIPVLLLPGNHDYARRWNALEPLLERFMVRVVPEVRRPESGGIVRIAARDNSTELEVAVLPWVSERQFVGARELMGLPGEPFQSYAEEMTLLIEKLCEPLDASTCTVFAGHLFVSGSRPGEGQRGLTIGQLYAIAPQALPEVQYAALGHVHRPQRVPSSSCPAYYSGSPLQLDFGDVEQQKSINIVELEPGQPANVRTQPINGGRLLRDVGGTYEEINDQKDSLGDAFLRVTLKCGGPLPGLGDQVRALLPNALEVRLDYPREDTQKEARIRGLTPRQQYAHYLREKQGAEPEKEELDLFESLLAEVSR